LQQLTVPAAPTKLDRVWNFSAICVAVLGVVSALLAIGVVRRQGSPSDRSPQKPSVQSDRNIVYRRSVVLQEEVRKVYPYSIVPGGAATVDDAKVAMARPDLRANYANIDFSKLRQEKLATNLSGYVSYRYGDKIYWTKKKLTLRAGEMVFTDGVHTVRGRCLNCYSAFPMLPIRPNEPSEKVLDVPVDVPVFAYKFPLLPVESPALPAPPGELTPVVPILPTGTPITGPGGGIWYPIIPIIPPIHRHHPGSPTPPITITGGSPPPPPPPPVAVVPEPNYAWLLVGGFFTLILIQGLRRRAILKSPK
jgi:hypothetical protein